MGKLDPNGCVVVLLICVQFRLNSIGGPRIVKPWPQWPHCKEVCIVKGRASEADESLIRMDVLLYL